MNVTPNETASHLARIDAERLRAGVERMRAIEAWLPELARVLRAEYGATVVRAFGSVVRGDAGPDSDLDVAVTGLSAVDAARTAGRKHDTANDDDVVIHRDDLVLIPSD